MKACRRAAIVSAATISCLTGGGLAADLDRSLTHAAPHIGEQVEAAPLGAIITPPSGLSTGTTAQTNVKIVVALGRHAGDTAPGGNYATPASPACIYAVTIAVVGCNPETLKTVATGGGKMIAIVDAYDNPNAASDLAAYSSRFGLPAITSSNVPLVYASGKQPIQDSTGGWGVEDSAAVDMANALAPGAAIVRVEAASASESDLVAAGKIAMTMVENAGGGEVSNGWTTREFSSEAKLEADSHGKNVVVFAATDDDHAISVPAALPKVIAVGASSMIRTASGKFVAQETWPAQGGGLSAYIATPPYQSPVTGVVGTHRGIPDIAADASTQGGIWIYDTLPFGGKAAIWTIVAGTAIAIPAVAAMVNATGIGAPYIGVGT